jgi:hypothetical protein
MAERFFAIIVFSGPGGMSQSLRWAWLQAPALVNHALHEASGRVIRLIPLSPIVNVVGHP